MSDRLKGTLLLAAGILTVGGVSTGNLPVMAFWVGLALYPIGGYLFLKGNRKAHEQLERKVQHSLHPTIRSQPARALADQQVARTGGGYSPTPQPTPQQPQEAAPAPNAPRDEIVLDEVEIAGGQLERDPISTPANTDPDFKVSEDVSFPVEVQERTKIADELRKLVRLFEDGILNETEFDAAKAKLLG